MIQHYRLAKAVAVAPPAPAAPTSLHAASPPPAAPSSSSAARQLPSVENAEQHSVYVFDCVATAGGGACVAASLSNRKVGVWDAATLQQTSLMTGHTARIHDLQAAAKVCVLTAKRAEPPDLSGYAFCTLTHPR